MTASPLDPLIDEARVLGIPLAEIADRLRQLDAGSGPTAAPEVARTAAREGAALEDGGVR